MFLFSVVAAAFNSRSMSSTSWAFIGFVLLCTGSCTPPVLDGEVREITTQELAAQYRDDPVAATHAYTGQRVQVLVRSFDRGEKNTVIWKVLYAKEEYPPTVIFEFEALDKIKAPCWVEGRCRGAVIDDRNRGIAGYNFTIYVSGCRVVTRSTPTEP